MVTLVPAAGVPFRNLNASTAVRGRCTDCTPRLDEYSLLSEPSEGPSRLLNLQSLQKNSSTMRSMSVRDVDTLRQTLPRVRTRSDCNSNDPLATAGPAQESPYCQTTNRTPQHSGIDPMFRTDNFMMYGFKVAMCSKQGRHPWSDCPYAHPTENARRRDPRIFSYSCVECPSYRCGFTSVPDLPVLHTSSYSLLSPPVHVHSFKPQTVARRTHHGCTFRQTILPTSTGLQREL
jgi:hypothetical protein